MSTSDSLPQPTPTRAPWLLLLSLLALAAFGIRTLSNSDFWIHLATGRLIAQNGLPKIDPFAYTTFADRTWVNPSWLYDLALYFMWRAGSAPVTILLHVAALVGGLALLLPAARRLGSDSAAAAALLLAAWLIAPMFSVSAIAWVILFLGIFLVSLSNGLPGWSGRVFLCGVQVVWTNMHSSFLLGPLLVVLFAAEAAVTARRQGADPAGGTRTLRSGLLLAGILLALTCVNPYLFGLHRYALQAMTNPNLTVMLEWVSPFQTDFIPFVGRHASTVSLVAIAAGFIAVRGRLPLAYTVLAVVSAFLLVLSPRYFEFSAALALPFTALSLHGAGAWLRERIGRPSAATARPSLLPRIVIAALALASVAAVASGYYYNRIGSASAPGLGVAPNLFPEKAAEVLLNRPDFPERSINMAMDGGYLAWKVPQRKIFTDTRGHVYGIGFYQGLARALLGPTEAWTNLVQRWQPEGVVLNCTWPGAGAATRRLLADNRWAMVYFDGTTVAMVTRTMAHSRLISDFEVQATGLRELEAAHRAYREEASGVLPARNPPSLIGAGAVDLALWRFREAETIYVNLVKGAPTMATAWLNLGICQHHRKAHAEAITTLKQATKLRPDGVLGWLWLGKSYQDVGDTAMAELAMKKARSINAAVAESFESGAQGATNTTLPSLVEQSTK